MDWIKTHSLRFILRDASGTDSVNLRPEFETCTTADGFWRLRADGIEVEGKTLHVTILRWLARRIDAQPPKGGS
jgi:hypothetical protein